MKLKLMKDGNSPVNTNSYLIYDEESKNAWIIDASTKTRPFIDKIKELDLNVKYLLLTHGHWDHIMSAEFWRNEYGAKIVAHEKGKDYLNDPEINGSSKYSQMPDYKLDADIYLQGDEGQFEIFKWFYTPGHSYDHLVYQLGENIVFSGDLIFFNSIGRTDIIGANFNDLKNSIRNIIYKKFNDKTILLPGHGNNTTVLNEKQSNPWVPFEE